MTARSVLVFSTDSFAAALIGAAIELAGYRVEYPLETESPRDAVMRVRPGAALVDCDHVEACTETFFGPALMVGARVAVFSSSRSRRTLEPIAEQFRVRSFAMPIDFDDLQALLASLLEQA